jgi:hypothetical protein
MGQGQALCARVSLHVFQAAFYLACSLFFFAPVHAFALELSFPGSFFGEVRYPNSPVQEERDNFSAEGNIEQGIDWIRIGKRLTLNTFAELRYTLDTAGLDYNNRVIPGIGIKLKARVGSGVVQFGVKGVEEYRFKSDRSAAIVLGFANWWFGWNLTGR